MNAQVPINATRKLPRAGIILLAAAAGLPLAGWWLHLDWTGVTQWLRALLVFYGAWMMDP